MSSLIFLLFNLETNGPNYITYRFSANVAAGRGLVYWTPDPAITTYPLVPFLLAAAGEYRIFAARLLCIFSSALGAWLLSRLAGDRWIAGHAYILGVMFDPSPMMLLMLALGLASVYLATQRRWVLAGILTGLAILSQPLAIILALLLALYSIRNPRALRRYLPPALLIPTFGMVILMFSLRAHDGMNLVAPVSGILMIALPVLAIYGLARNGAMLRQQPQVGILVAWSAISAVLSLMSGNWLTLAVLPGAILLAISVPLPIAPLLTLLAIAADLALNGLISSGHPSGKIIADWINANSAAGDVIAVNDLGPLSYYTGRPVIDLTGQLQSVRLDRAFFIRYAPAVLVLHPDTRVPWNGFLSAYTIGSSPAGQTVYRRMVNFSPLDEHPVDIVYGANLRRADLRLKRIAIANTIHPADLVRVRLDWELAYAPSYDTEIKLDLLDPQGNSIGGFADKLPPEQWHAGQMSTYHLFTLNPNPPLGPLSVNVGFRIRNGNLGDHVVAQTTLAK